MTTETTDDILKTLEGRHVYIQLAGGTTFNGRLRAVTPREIIIDTLSGPIVANRDALAFAHLEE